MGFDLIKYYINPKYSDRYTGANSADPDQMLENEIDTVCNSPSNLDTTRDSKMDMFKLQKYIAKIKDKEALFNNRQLKLLRQTTSPPI